MVALVSSVILKRVKCWALGFLPDLGSEGVCPDPQLHEPDVSQC